ncbi:hypothetical protein VTN77DRAFT_8102 [Rasamsonia byssochlamydoides]|uniref:uncharacterized protein n=1 Tax=Rasamsonia byssochlamydoides TaxID=89139 RepID=UPI0037441EE4
MTGRQVSHGRGGAGNMYSRDSPTTPKDLVTPTIKQDIFTTGRGGSGNMMHNDPEHPELARESQDVEEPPMRSEDNVSFAGRGGVANAYIPAIEECLLQRTKSNGGQPTTERTSSKERPKEVPGKST